MIKFLTSLSFLYLFTIITLFVYGWIYYRKFARNRSFSGKFPLVFSAIAVICLGFLYLNFNAPLSFRTFSNLDHSFIRHDGFAVNKKIEIGRTDTVNRKNNAYNSFFLEKNDKTLNISSSYTEEPLYTSAGNSFKILSANYPASGHLLLLSLPEVKVAVKTVGDNQFELSFNDTLIGTATKNISKAIDCWNLFRDQPGFINSEGYRNNTVFSALKQVYILRDNVSNEKTGELKYFVSGKLFQYAKQLSYDSKIITREELSFSSSIPDNALIAWGIGFLDNNRNQYRVHFLAGDSFQLLNRYPVSYPLTEENKNDWTSHRVNKFLISDPSVMKEMSPVFNEGFLFSAFTGDNTLDFSPVLLSYRKDRGGKDLEMEIRSLDGNNSVQLRSDKFYLPASSKTFSWLFSVQNSMDWKLGSFKLSSGRNQLIIFSSLLFFTLLVLVTAFFNRDSNVGWIWQLLSILTLVLLTTRFFLYWRYKSFPPFEGLDLPSVQQLNSPWNFGITVLTCLVLALVFGFGAIRNLWNKALSTLKISKSSRLKNQSLINEDDLSRRLNKSGIVKRTGVKIFYFLAWFILLISAGGYAALNDFDPSACRHLALALVASYFVFLYISYKFSPLVSSAESSWWGIRTSAFTQVFINNPVKVLLSLSLLALFAFIDIGFAIIFLNFLLFNEAFLCINYAIAGLSAGSKKNSFLFGVSGVIYTALFVINLLFGPYVFNLLLGLSKFFYIAGYLCFALIIGYLMTRIMPRTKPATKLVSGLVTSVFIFTAAFLFFPRQKILDKAAVTKYRIDVMTMPVDKAIEIAYQDGKTYEPVIRAAQNQWFINTFIYEKNNPQVNTPGFHLLPHAPQTKGAKYNAQATDLVASRFLIAEHGKWSVLLYVLLLLVPSVLLASFYKLYPDFTNRVNHSYPTVTTGFSILNYLLITALLVILAATGRYIFFGQDLPFGSILSKQSVMFPAIILIAVICLFKKIPLEQYPNRKKLLPGTVVFAILFILLFFVKPAFNKEKEFGASDIARDMDSYIESRLQPIIDYIDTSSSTKKLSIAKKDRLFTDTLRQLLESGYMNDAGKFFRHELASYAKSEFSRHLDQRKLIYLDIHTGRPQLAVNDNYFHIDPPPHLRELWTGNVYGDTANWNLSLIDSKGSVVSKRISNYTGQRQHALTEKLSVVFKKSLAENIYDELVLVNNSTQPLTLSLLKGTVELGVKDSMLLSNPSRLRITSGEKEEYSLVVEPDAFMKNYFVNGNRYYVYPMGEDFIWARNFAESVSSEYTSKGLSAQHAFISVDALLTDSLTQRIKTMMLSDTSYKNGAEYGICIADGNGRLIAMTDHVKGLQRPDPNDKPAFNKLILGNNGYVSQSLLRKEIGNINLLRMNPGPGSTLKPVVFSAIASQLNLDWDKFAAEGFSQKQQFFGGEKVAEYDFEKNNGRISSVVDYLKYSDNYYHSNLLLLGSYSRQSLQELLSKYFATRNPENDFHWPYFSYNGKQYWLDGFKNWPGYLDGRANFGSDSSFISIGLFNNYGIYTERSSRAAERFSSSYDSLLFREAYRKSGFILPEYALFDQKGTGMDTRKPNEVFMSSFRGHVKGSSQVMIPPVKMLDAFGKLATQNRNYSLTLNPYAKENEFRAFEVDAGVQYSNYLSVIREKVFEGMKQALYNGTASKLGSLLKNETKWHYYVKTGTTGDDEMKTKSKLFAIIISEKDITDPDFNFRKNKFYTIYFTSQNGPAKQNEEFQAEIIKYVQESAVFNKYMK